VICLKSGWYRGGVSPSSPGVGAPVRGRGPAPRAPPGPPGLRRHARFAGSRTIPPGRSASSCRTTGACTAVRTGAITGRTWPTACRPISASRWRCTRTTRTRSTSFRSSRTCSGARPKRSCASTARATRASRGKGSRKGCRRMAPYESVLRDGLATDTHDPAGVYFGTRSGKLFGSANDGNSWRLILEGLPPITCVKACVKAPVKAAVVSGTSSPRRTSARKPSRKTKPRQPARRKRARA